MKDATVRFRKPGESRDSRSGSGFGLPADLLRKSRKRIRIVALLVLLGAGLDVVLMVGSLVATAMGWARPEATGSSIPFAGSVIGTVASLAVVLAAGSDRIRDTVLIRLVLAYEVFLCLTLSLSNPVSVYETGGGLPTLTWVTPLIIMFPLIVPCAPRAILITSLLAAATRPVGLLVLDRAGLVVAGGEDYFAAAFSPSIAVAIAYFGARTVYGLGIEVAQARRMGSYSLERILGRGGMGEVWLGRHAMLARPAAVKLVRPDLPGVRGAREAEVMLERFEREAQATAALRSPHTIGLYDYGVSDDGTFYYVMELLDGLDADSLVSGFGPVPPERAVHILRGVCHSLSEAHGAGLIHRDIKPANVFVCRYGRDLDFVKVLDFGLVKATVDPEPDAGLTVAGSVRGTPAFMAPEQARGSDRVDARADLYAVGCLAYWLLTGQRVFEGETAMEVLMHHVGTPPVPPSLRTEVRVPAELERIVMDCLEKDPGRRPASAAALAGRLDGCPLESPWTPDRARRWWETHRPETVGAAAPEIAASAV